MKRTKKFIAAEETALEIGINVDSDIYKNLEQYNYFWDSNQGEWLQGEEADPPTNFIKIRVWADGKKLEEDCKKILHALASDFILEEISEPYSCSPPKQLESRIYLILSRRK